MKQNYKIIFPERSRVSVVNWDMPQVGDNDLLVKASVSQISTGTELTMLECNVEPDSPWLQNCVYPNYKVGYSMVGTVVFETTGVPSLAGECGKVLMYGFVCRFDRQNAYLKDMIDRGKLGNIYYCEAYRMERCSTIGGWFRNKEISGGGQMMDAAIHQLDLLLYFMGYPRAVAVKAFTSHANSDLPDRIQGVKCMYNSVSANTIPRTVESFCSAYITFEGGRNLFIKAAHIANTLNPGTQLELMGDLGGACIKGGELQLLTIDETNHFVESKPFTKEDRNMFHDEIRHFVDCCNTNTQPLCTPREGTEIMRLLNAIYESAETGREVIVHHDLL